MTRTQAVDVVRQHGEEKPDREIDLFCEYTRITRRRFFEISDRFRNPNVWKLRGNSWQIDDFLIKDWAWR
jgi:hypothetical protein